MANEERDLIGKDISSDKDNLSSKTKRRGLPVTVPGQKMTRRQENGIFELFVVTFAKSIKYIYILKSKKIATEFLCNFSFSSGWYTITISNLFVPPMQWQFN